MIAPDKKGELSDFQALLKKGVQGLLEIKDTHRPRVLQMACT